MCEVVEHYECTACSYITVPKNRLNSHQKWSSKQLWRLSSGFDMSVLFDQLILVCAFFSLWKCVIIKTFRIESKTREWSICESARYQSRMHSIDVYGLYMLRFPHIIDETVIFYVFSLNAGALSCVHCVYELKKIPNQRLKQQQYVVCDPCITFSCLCTFFYRCFNVRLLLLSL